MKRFIVGLLALVLVCSSLSSTSFANNTETDDDYSISTVSDLDLPDFSRPDTED